MDKNFAAVAHKVSPRKDVVHACLHLSFEPVLVHA